MFRFAPTSQIHRRHLCRVLAGFSLVVTATSSAEVVDPARLPAAGATVERIADARPLPLITTGDRALAVRLAEAAGLPIAFEAHGRQVELQGIANGIPQYYITDNVASAISIATDRVQPGGGAGLNLTGSGVTLGIWDGGAVFATHSEFQGRVTQQDSPSGPSTHATHVGGTMIAGGVWPGNNDFAPGESLGMSYAASLAAYDWNSDEVEMGTAGAAGLRVSNHSYGLITGWYFNGSDWYWFGDVTVDAFEDYSFGRYSSQAADWDEIAFDNPYYLWCKSAGNDRNDDPGSGAGHFYFDPITGWTFSNDNRSPDGNNGYDSISHAGNAKNGMTVGAVNDVAGGYSGPGSVNMSSFSGWGPTDDGRIKPDISANGVGLFSSDSVDGSTNFWSIKSGTSMSSPSVAGSLGLLIEHWRNLNPGADDMRASTLKGLVLHTADEAGDFDGPDYRFGWGLMNTERAAEVITLDATNDIAISEHILSGGTPFEQTITSDGSGELRVTICWTDPAASPTPIALDNPASVLINNLDLRLIQGGATFEPWILDRNNPNAAATTGDNDVDNVEQIVIANPVAGDYTLRVTNDGALQGGSQVFSVIITGATAGGGSSPLGDMNCDGVVDAFDISAFILALTDPGQYAIDFPACDITNGDVNSSGGIDAFDIGPFIALLTGA